MTPSSPAPETPPLDLHEGIATPPAHEDPRQAGCLRWPETLRLLNLSSGELVLGRCKATNLCPYCARLYAIETSEMLLLDAMEDAPALYVVLTARAHLTRGEVNPHLVKLRRAARRRWPGIRWAVIVEFQRRGALHLNLLVKGVPVEDDAELRKVLVGLWCSRVDADPAGQWVGAVNEGPGLVRYIALHFLKADQAPAIGWRGHRTSYSRDYLVRPASVMRLEAQRSLKLKRLLWRGFELEAAELELARRQLDEWDLRHHDPSVAGRLLGAQGVV